MKDRDLPGLTGYEYLDGTDTFTLTLQGITGITKCVYEPEEPEGKYITTGVVFAYAGDIYEEVGRFRSGLVFQPVKGLGNRAAWYLQAGELVVLTKGKIVGVTMTGDVLEGRVVATDISSAMLSVAKQKSSQLGLTGNLEFHVMDARELDFPDGKFDRVLCRLVLMFLPDVHRALTRMRTLLRPGGTLAAAVLGPAQKIPAITIWQGALAKERQVSRFVLHSARPVATDEIDPFRFSDPQELAFAVSQAGFQDVVTECLTTTQCFDSCEEFVRFQLDMDPAIHGQLSALGMSSLLGFVREALRPYLDPDGRVRLPGQHNIVAGRAP